MAAKYAMEFESTEALMNRFGISRQDAQELEYTLRRTLALYGDTRMQQEIINFELQFQIYRSAGIEDVWRFYKWHVTSEHLAQGVITDGGLQ